MEGQPKKQGHHVCFFHPVATLHGVLRTREGWSANQQGRVCNAPVTIPVLLRLAILTQGPVNSWDIPPWVCVYVRVWEESVVAATICVKDAASLVHRRASPPHSSAHVSPSLISIVSIIKLFPFMLLRA